MSARSAVRVGAAVLAAMLPSACGQETPAGFGPPPASVTAFTAVARDVPSYLDEIGRALASESVTLMPQVSGRVTAIRFVDGADVAVDAPLYEIDARPFEARAAEARARAAAAGAGLAEAAASSETAKAKIGTARSRLGEAAAGSRSLAAMAEAAHADVEAARAEAERAASDAKRWEQVGAGGVSELEVGRVRAEARSAAARHEAAARRDASAAAQVAQAQAAEASAAQAVKEAESQAAEAEARVASARADVQQAEAAVETARLDVEYCSIRSPLAGRAGRRLVDVGNVVTANVTPLLSIQRVDPIHVEFTTTEESLPAVQAALARGEVEAWASLPEAPDDRRKGVLSFVDNAVAEGLGSVRMRATVPNADARFWPGRFARVRLVLETLAKSVLVPAECAQVGAMGTYAYVIRPAADAQRAQGVEWTAELRPVTLGQRQDDLVVVRTGLQPGERVVRKGGITVFPGAALRILDDAPAGAPAGKAP